MRKTYKSSNVRFCMEDENQRRTWEYLQSLTRKDSSYGKALSDAFVLVLDGKLSKGEAEELCLSTSVAEKAISEGNIPCGKMLSEDAFHKDLKATAEHIEESLANQISKMQEAFLRQLTKELEEHALRTVSGEETPHREQCEKETDMSDAMMSMALAMGE
ncbi:MAG: hypothetical protein MR992_10680 [Lachnospiraceae bacterium]|nr:hypothetical protein [Lachnospiraceae bacterium]MDD7627197.1 hypothetical protein [Lachnospiraceae bacterium]MDY4118487.1 hypothetical protein [Lachnospiraceae bacterium]